MTVVPEPAESTGESAAAPEEGSPDAESGGRATTLNLALALLAILAVAVGGYALGRGSGEDLASARDGGASAGREAGLRTGRRAGYALGLAAARAGKDREAYADAYREAYERAFESKGLYPPKPGEIELAGAP
jgi:hypothetical protein